MSRLIAASEGATPAVVSRPRPLTQEEVIQRLQQDRKILVAALRRIHQDAPAEEPEYRAWSDSEEAEAWGLEMGAWEAGEVAREALEQVGADPRGDS